MAKTLPDPTETPVLSVEEAGRILGFGRSRSYEEAKRFIDTGGAEGLPVMKFGGALRVPTAKLLDMLGVAS